MRVPEVVKQGKDNGEGMIVRSETTRGTAIFGLAIPNVYSHADWDLGPTWCYVIVNKHITLIDTGRRGNYDLFSSLLDSIDLHLRDLDRIVITHSHEDHDGNLAEIMHSTGATLCAHPIYPSMISYYPDIHDGALYPDRPGSCRLCEMPDKFARQCLTYQEQRSLLVVDCLIEDNASFEEDNLYFIHTPGHTPDSLCIVLEDEALFTGDSLLPDITPHPSLAHAFEANVRILPKDYRRQNSVYGLMKYIESLNRIAFLPHQPFDATFTAHRLFYDGRFNLIHTPPDRAKEIIQFHRDRCRSIVEIAQDKDCTLKEIAKRHFPPSLLKGGGESMAVRELRAHTEILEDCGDIQWAGPNKDQVHVTGTTHFMDQLEAYLQSDMTRAHP